MALFIGNDAIAQILTPRLCLEALEEAFGDLGAGAAATMIGRETMATRIPSEGSVTYHALEPQGAILPRRGVSALRVKSGMIRWTGSGASLRRSKVPAAEGRYAGFVMLFDVATCAPVALMPDGLIQRMRVGATSALGAASLARADAHTVGLFGAGWQAGAQLAALREVRALTSVTVFSPDPTRRRAFCADMERQLEIPVRPVDTPEEAARDVDILLSATNSRAATILPAMAEPGRHLGVINVEELAADVLPRAELKATSQRLRLGSYHWAIASGSTADIHEREFEHGWWQDESLWERFAELADLVGRPSPRAHDDQVSLFVSNGSGIQFAAVGARILEAARERGLGQSLPEDLFLQPFPS